MKLDKKKELAVRTLGVGKARIIFNVNRLDEIKEAITKQDIRDLKTSGAIRIKEIKGSRPKKKRKTRRRAGSVKKKVNTRKEDYMALTRKLRAYLAELRKKGSLSLDDYRQLRKEVRTKAFRSLANLRERIKELGKEE